MPWRLAAIVGLITFAWAAPAAATTYCVAPASGCGGGDLSTLTAALNAASANAGADDVRLGAVTYTDGPWSYNDFGGTNPVTIRGTGQLDSRLVSFGGGPTLSLVNGNVDNVLVYFPAVGAPKVSLSLILGTLSNSQVLVAAGGTGVDASAATIDAVSIAPNGAAATGNTAVVADNTTLTNTFLSTTNGVVVNNPPVAVRRSTIVTQGYGLQSGLSGTAISDTLIVLNDPTAVGVEGVCDLATGTNTIDAKNLTVTGAGAGGIAFRSAGGQLCGGYVEVSSSVVRDVGTTVSCVPGSSGSGSASVAVSYSDAALGGGAVSGSCSSAVDAGNNFFADPLFASPATLQPVPRFDSPLIDAGDPAAPGPGQPTDRSGLPRAVNGRRDIGAFEYGRRAPSLSVAGNPATVMVSEPVAFNATTSDPDPGDVVTVAWSFDDGSVATGSDVSHAFSTAGTHTAAATATDSAGVTTVRSVSVAVTKPAEDTTPPETTITLHAKKSTKKRKATFRFTSSEPGGSFECTLDKRAPAPCVSPFAKKVKAGRKPHRFSVIAIDAAGNRDATPASFSWKVKKKAN